ncbi:MAG: flavin reductase family protein [Syntrophobacteraceae bacterium]
MKKSLGALDFVYPMPVWVVATYGPDGKPNAMTSAAGMTCCRVPPCVAISLREATYTFHNIKERRAFTVNIPSQDYVRQTDYLGIATGRKEDKFTTANLTSIKSELVDAPYVAEFPVVLECRLIRTIELGSHTQFIGDILDLKADEDVLGKSGKPELHLVRPILYDTGHMAYYEIGQYLGKARSIGLALRS